LDGLVIDLDVDVEVNGLVLWSHQEFESFAKSWNLLMRCFVGTKLIETSMIVLSLDSTGSVRGTIYIDRETTISQVEANREGG